MNYRIHLLLTGPPGAGKTSIGKIISKKMACPFLDTKSFHDKNSNFSYNDAQLALDLYIDSLIKYLKNSKNKLIISEGFFLDNIRRYKIWEVTTSHSVKFIPITLLYKETEIKKRAGNKLNFEKILYFLFKFRENPWGTIFNTNESLQKTVDSILKFINKKIATYDKYLIRIYFDNTTWDYFFYSLDLPISQEKILSFAYLFDAFIWADEIIHINNKTDLIYQYTAKSLEKVVASSGDFAELVKPINIQLNDSLYLQALTEAYRIIKKFYIKHKSYDLFKLDSSIQIKKNFNEFVNEIGQFSNKDLKCIKIEKFNFLSKFRDALYMLPEIYYELKKIIPNIAVEETTYWILVHRIFRCCWHNIISTQLNAIYWPCYNRLNFMKNFINNPIILLREKFNEIIPFYGAYLLLPCTMSPVPLKNSLKDLHDFRLENEVDVFKDCIRKLLCYLGKDLSLKEKNKQITTILEKLRNIKDKHIFSLKDEFIMSIFKEFLGKSDMEKQQSINKKIAISIDHIQANQVQVGDQNIITKLNDIPTEDIIELFEIINNEKIGKKILSKLKESVSHEVSIYDIIIKLYEIGKVFLQQT